MSKKGILYILLVLGIILAGGGAWLLYNPMTKDTLGSPVTIDIPDGNPVIYEQARYIMSG